MFLKIVKALDVAHGLRHKVRAPDVRIAPRLISHDHASADSAIVVIFVSELFSANKACMSSTWNCLVEAPGTYCQ